MLYILENENIKVEISSHGATIEKIINKKTGNNHYWDYDKEIWPRRTSVCFPICGVLAQGKYLLNGVEYAVEPHGFLREMDLEAAVVEEDKLCLVAKSNEWTKGMYPYEFLFEITFIIKEELTIIYDVHNFGDSEMLFSTGSHYTYSVPINKADDYAQYYVVAGEKTLYLKDDVFANGPIVVPATEIPENKVSIKNLQSDSETEVSFENFPYCVIWSKPGVQPFVCIEPWAGLADDVNKTNLDFYKKNEIKILAPKATERFTQIVKIK